MKNSCLLCCSLLLAAFASVQNCAAADDTENWQLKGQATAIYQNKPSFGAAYSGPNSLGTQSENSHSVTATLFAGARLWQGSELYFNPEMALGIPFSDLHGLGGFNNGEMARTSGASPRFYRARLFLRQTWGLGGGEQALESDANQLAGTVDAKRLVLTAGNFSALDIFDANTYSHEPRQSFMNWTFMAQGAWDYPADARGYTWGAALEYITPQWSVRGGRFMLPKDSNGLPLNSRIFSSYGDVVELERGYQLNGRKGRVRLLGFRNQAVMGTYSDALSQAAASGATPDLTQVRSPQGKRGAGINIEQELAESIGMFLRAGANDGRTETFAFTEIDRSVSGGAVIDGARWQRSGDTVGVAIAANGLSPSHRAYLAAGGSGFFLGDGNLNYHSEDILETFYSIKAARALWVSLDYQYIRNPGYNADRGPAHFFGIRLHAEL